MSNKMLRFQQYKFLFNFNKFGSEKVIIRNLRPPVNIRNFIIIRPPNYSHSILQYEFSVWRNCSKLPIKSCQSYAGIHGLTKVATTGTGSSGTTGSYGLFKPFLFAVSFSLGSFVAAAIWEYERVRSMATAKQPFEWMKKNYHQNQKRLDDWKSKMSRWWKNDLSAGEQAFIPIFVANMLVFGLWRIPRLQPVMMKYFCSNPVANAVCWPMILSTFSHHSLFHIFANMYVLHSFSLGAVSSLGKEQFYGMYMTAGVLSSFSSYMYKTICRAPGSSLGASGAIMAVLAYICLKYPDTQLGILLIPNLTFSAGSAIKVIMGIDLAGCLFGWKFFDHAAHLGGAFFGLFWCYVGSEYVWPQRQYVQQYWHNFRAIK